MRQTIQFILSEQAKVTTGLESLTGNVSQMQRMMTTMATLYDRERKDLREKVTALVDAQSRSEDRLDEFIGSSEEKFNALIASQLRTDEVLAKMAAGNEARDQALAEMMRAITHTSQRVDELERPRQ